MKYYQLTFTLDEKVRGKYEMPHTISIESKDFLEYISDKARNISVYFENKESLYEDMPEPIYGKLIKRKNVVDFMDFTPSCLSLIAVISGKIKGVFEKLRVSKEEYSLKEISIKGYAEPFYLLFIPLISDTEFIYSVPARSAMSERRNNKFHCPGDLYSKEYDYLYIGK